jgi:hypothetical protein
MCAATFTASQLPRPITKPTTAKAGGKEESDMALNKVGEIYLNMEDDQLVGVEVGFTPNVQTKVAGAMILDQMRKHMDMSAWQFNTIARIEDAQTNAQANSGGDTDPEVSEGSTDVDDAVGTEPKN